MRRLFDFVLVVFLVSVSTIFIVIAVLFPAPGVRALARRIATTFSDLAKNV